MARNDGAEFLTASPLFVGLPAQAIRTLASLSRAEHYPARAFISHEGDPAVWFCVVRSGHVKIIRRSRSGRDVVLDVLGPGEPFGGVAVIERRPYPASAQALEPAAVLKIPQHAIVALADRHPSLIKEMALMLGRRLRAAHDSVASLAADPSRPGSRWRCAAWPSATASARGKVLPCRSTLHARVWPT
jgi:CRP/FNR family transcriptional regulator